jgi:16S rRNA (guanine527-N7)-methyltransferase
MEEIVHEVHHLVGIEISEKNVAALARYQHELNTWNKRFNLTAIRDPNQVRVKHFLDSLTCLLAMRGSPVGRVIDIGTGAGFPGLVLKIIRPTIQLTLVESIGKKAEFCRHIAQTLNLEGVEILQDRAERVGKMARHREQYNWAIARAVANMPVLAEYLLPLVKVGGRALAQKGESGPAEAQASEKAIQVLGGHLRQIISLHLPGVTEERYLVVLDKIAATPQKYPRRVGIPSKRPLK